MQMYENVCNNTPSNKRAQHSASVYLDTKKRLPSREKLPIRVAARYVTRDSSRIKWCSPHPSVRRILFFSKNILDTLLSLFKKNSGTGRAGPVCWARSCSFTHLVGSRLMSIGVHAGFSVILITSDLCTFVNVPEEEPSPPSPSSSLASTAVSDVQISKYLRGRTVIAFGA